MSDFEIKITPRSKEEVSNYKNFFPLKNTSFETWNGKIVYLNANHPDKHIYQPYYMDNGLAKPLQYMSSGSLDREWPLFTLQELSYEDVMIYYTKADVERLKEQKEAKKTAKLIPTK